MERDLQDLQVSCVVASVEVQSQLADLMLIMQDVNLHPNVEDSFM